MWEKRYYYHDSNEIEHVFTCSLFHSISHSFPHDACVIIK